MNWANRRPWTEAEDDVLRRDYSGSGAFGVAKSLGRPAWAVAWRAFRLAPRDRVVMVDLAALILAVAAAVVLLAKLLSLISFVPHQ